MRAPRTLNVAELSLCELGTIVYGSDCPVARAECLAEIARRAQVRARECRIM